MPACNELIKIVNIMLSEIKQLEDEWEAAKGVVLAANNKKSGRCA